MHLKGSKAAHKRIRCTRVLLSLLGGTQREQRDLRGTIETHRYADSPNATIGVQGQGTDPAKSPGILSSEDGEIRSTNQWQSDLTSMRVSGNLQIDRVLSHVVGPVRLMGQQDNRLARGNSVQGQIETGFSFQDVIHAREPESFALAFQRDGPVAQDRNSVRLQDGGYVGCIRTYIMVSQDRDNSGMGAKLGEQLGA